MAAQPDFVDVMAGFVGLRLAAWDELALQGPATLEQLAAWLHPRSDTKKIHDALTWLAVNRLVKIEETTGRWHPVPTVKAMAVYQEFGPIMTANYPARIQPAAPSEQPTLRMAPQPQQPVHTHQAQFELV